MGRTRRTHVKSKCIQILVGKPEWKRFEAFTATMFQVEVFWAVTPCGVVRYQLFKGSMDLWNVGILPQH